MKINNQFISLKKPLVVMDMEFAVLDISIYRKEMLKRKFKTFEVIEMGIVSYQADGKETTYENYVKPKFKRYKIDEKVKKLTGIEESDLRTGVSFPEMYQAFMKHYIPGETYLLTWGNGDLPVFKRMCEKYHLPYLIRNQDFIDISEVFHDTYELNKMELISLERTLHYLEIDPHNKHRALADAYAALEVFLKIMNDAKAISI